MLTIKNSEEYIERGMPSKAPPPDKKNKPKQPKRKKKK